LEEDFQIGSQFQFRRSLCEFFRGKQENVFRSVPGGITAAGVVLLISSHTYRELCTRGDGGGVGVGVGVGVIIISRAR